MPYAKPETAPEWIKATDAAAVLGVDTRTVVRMIQRSETQVRTVKLDRGVLIHREDWQAELDRRRIPVGTSA
jgi:carbamoylphosphate synthase small subunit